MKGLLALALSIAALAIVPPADAVAGAPTHVRATVHIVKVGHYQVTIKGSSASGARVVLQDRADAHENWVTQTSTGVNRRDRFRLRFPQSRLRAQLRVCVVRPGADACTPVGPIRVVKVPGQITLGSHAAQLVPYETDVVATVVMDKVTACCGEVAVDFQDPATHRWRPVGRSIRIERASPYSTEFTLRATDFAGLVSKQGLKLRVATSGNPWVRDSVRAWKVDSYTQRSLGQLPIASGTMSQGSIVYGFIGAAPVASAALSPTDSVSLSVPAGCGRIQAGVSQDLAIGTPGGTWSATVLRNGVTAFDTTTAPSKVFSLDVAGGDTVTLSVAYDSTHPAQRPWFVSPYPASAVYPKQPFILCAAP